MTERLCNGRFRAICRALAIAVGLVGLGACRGAEISNDGLLEWDDSQRIPNFEVQVFTIPISGAVSGLATTQGTPAAPTAAPAYQQDSQAGAAPD